MKPFYFILVVMFMLVGVRAISDDETLKGIMAFCIMWFFTYKLSLEDDDA